MTNGEAKPTGPARQPPPLQPATTLTAPAKVASKTPLIIGAVVVIVIAVVLVLALVFIRGNSSTLVGRWNIDSYSEMDISLPGAGGYIEFNANGTGTMNVTFSNGYKVQNFNWTCKGDRVVLSGVTGTYKINDNTLTMSCNFWDLTGTKS